MEKDKRCCFCGHSKIWDSGVKERIKSVAEDLIVNHNITEFWVGNYGAFDSYATSAIKELKRQYEHIELDLIIPYITNPINENKESYYNSYDNILIADIPESTPKRFHIIKANEYMINHSAYLICYIEWSWGGAIRTYEYAKRNNLQIFNVAEKPL